MSKVVLSEFREENYVVEFGVEVNNGDNFLVSSELVESDPMQFVGSLIDYLETNGMVNQSIVSLDAEFVVISGFNSQKSYSEGELRDACVAEVFVENLFNLFCGV